MLQEEIKVLVTPLIKVYKTNTTSVANIMISENKMLQLLTNTAVCLEQIGTLFRSEQVQMGRISLGKISLGAENQRFCRVDDNESFRLSEDRDTIYDFVSITENLIHNLERWIAANIGIGGSDLKREESEFTSKSQKCDNCHSTIQSMKLKSLKDELLSKPGINYSFERNGNNENSLDEDEDKDFLDSNFWSGFTRQEYEREKNNLYPKADAYLIHWLAQEKLKQSKFNEITLSTETGEKHEKVDGYMIDELIDTMLRILRKHMGKKHMVWKMKQFADIITKVYEEKKIEDECKNEEKKNEEAAFSQSKCTCTCERHSIQVVHHEQKQRKEKNRGSKLNSKDPTPMKSKAKEQSRKDSVQSKKNEKNETKVSDSEIEDEEEYADYVDIEENFKAPSKNSERQSVVFKEKKDNKSNKRFSVVGKIGLGFREKKSKILAAEKENSSEEEKHEEVEIISKDKLGNPKKKETVPDESNPIIVMEEKETQCNLIDHKEFEELLEKKKELLKAISEAKSNHQEIKNHRSLLKNSYEGSKMKTEPKHNDSILENAQDENMNSELNINHSSKNLISLQKISKISTRSSKVFQTKIKVKNNRVSLLNKSVEEKISFTLPGLEETPVEIKESNEMSVHISNLKENRETHKETTNNQNIQKSLESVYRHKSVISEKTTEKPKPEHLKSVHKSYKPVQAKTESAEPLYKTQTFKVSTSDSISQHYKEFGEKVEDLMKKIENKSNHQSNKKAAKFLNKEIVVKNIDQKTKVEINQKLFTLDDLELFGGVSESSNFLKNLQNLKENKAPTQQNDNVEEFCIKLLKHIEYLHNYNGHIFENVVSFICHPYKTVEMQKIISTKTDMNKMANIIRTLLKWHEKMCGNCVCFHVQSFMTKILYFRNETDL